MSTIIDIAAREILDSRGNPDRRSRRDTRERRRRAARLCRAARPPASTKRVSCATATPERYVGKGVQKAVQNIEETIAPALDGIDRDRPDGDRPHDDRARRHAEQGEARRERDSRRVDGDRPRGRRRDRSAAVPLPRRPAVADAAGADDEHPQRRRARDQHGGLPGVHDRAGRRRDVRRSAAHGRGGVSRAQESAREAEAGDRRRRRRRLRAGPQG